ncbi:MULTISPECIES: phage major capsid protein [Gilliamella]|jgi:phage major capsid protein, HK97 family|uniref:Phage major capsid protein n=1 Tax=Gilliamella apicola TaxID=1196095 RepID=A0A556SCQ4_9GAMM|nr:MULTISPECIES: phage major capsid protein [Gilliamella]MBI0095012.1 phage major capsid protein [Gilliamella sp. W8136]TSJ98931.1 phage major capsid protein [Gilliamella apicola]
MKKLIELRQLKASKVSEMRSILDKVEQEKRSMTPEEKTQFDTIKAKVEELNTEISNYETLANEERSLADKSKPVDKKLTNEELRNYIRTGEARSLSTAVPADGGYTVIPELDKEIMRQLSDESEMRAICTVKKIGSNEYKKLVSVGGAIVNHGEEGTARTETATPKLEEVSIKLYPIYAYPKTTQEILDFSDLDVLSWLTDEIKDTFVETEELDLISGNGTKKAKGFLAYPQAAQADKARPFGTLEKMTTNAITADSLIDLLFKLKKKYRKNAVWVMNSNTAATLQKLKNGNGDYIWRDGLQAGDPDMLLGKPVHYLENMNDTGAVVAVGDFKRGYYIIDHETGVRTRPDNITEPGFYKVHTDKYLGGGLVDSNAIKILEVSAGK